MKFLDGPLVTVITVTYNSSRFVRDAIESVLEQGYSNIQYIIGDDCSTDDTWKIINEYQDHRILRYQNEQNLREYNNRNKALSLAKGKYTLFIDGDDIVFAHGISFMVHMMEAFPAAAFCVTGADSDKKRILPLEYTPQEICRTYFLGESFLDFSMVGTMFKTEPLQKLNGFNTNCMFADTNMRMSLALNYNCVLINGTPTYGRAVPGQATEKVKTFKGFLEQTATSFNFLENAKKYFNQTEHTQAAINLKNPLAKIIIKKLLKFQWSEAQKLFVYFKSLTDFWQALTTQPARNFESEYGFANLKRMKFRDTPFGNKELN
jgi:glycosyltransferase involved in cell wall biosynthesis